MYMIVCVCVCRFHRLINDKSTATVDEQSEEVQEFYTVRHSLLPPPPSHTHRFSIGLTSSPTQSMSDRLTSHTLFRDMAEEQQEDMMDGIEKHLMTNIYHM